MDHIKIIVFNAKPLPNNPSTLLMPKALQVIDEEAFAGVKASGVKGIALHDDDIVVSCMGYKETDEYLDIFKLLRTDEDLLDSDYTDDGLHPNDQAYIIISDYLKAILFEKSE